MSKATEVNAEIKIGLTMGDINGIGPEIIIKTLMDPHMHHICTPILYGSNKVISYHRKTFESGEFNLNIIRNAESASSKKANLINCWEEEVKIDIGQSTNIGGRYALKSLEAACKDLKENKIDAIITAPINKLNIQAENFNFPGHTEFLAKEFGSDNMMLLVSENLRVAFVTGHVPLRQVADSLNADTILKKLRILNRSLINDFSIRKPKIAVLGLNPHAGENGLLGKEEIDVIIPAINAANAENIFTFGPFPSDSFFGSGTHLKYDGILAMYHDQGLIPFKTLAFDSGVNYTAGLSIIRTSPDHGTAYDIAGKGIASENSFRQAIFLACDIYKNRKMNAMLNENPLKFTKKIKEKF